MGLIHPLMGIVGLAGLTIAAGYALLAVIAALVWQMRRMPKESRSRLPPLTLLKPLCGAEPSLYENLRSFCEQDYPEFQIVFGVLDPADAALSVVERLVAEFPSLPIDVVINSQLHGGNRKTSNLINLLAQARHDVLVMADSDARVGPEYLKTVSAPLLDREIGLVTCIFRGIAVPRLWSRLGAMYINEWYMPSVLLARLFGHRGYVSGQTICLRRETLQAMGGLQIIADHLADDYQLGERVRGLGLRIVLSHYMPTAEHDEASFGSLNRHELRWMSTIRILRPRSFCLLFFSFSLPLATLGIVLNAADPVFSTAAWALFEFTVVARLTLYGVYRLRDDRNLLSDLWLVPVRDLLICWVWWRSFFTSRVTWRGLEFDVDARGIMHRTP
ncbi:MAG TPA: bacteriohopanetetrol glucosamine biosynthesis glycosyltransferase HpnI [Steroidobacteraceae bacterium]|jgi:ceramide glucosyltransferase|nr:bacteriohopanetetrol glucosamine biosynthesis glycosyltransferase HpnI [Steroidobacteraceae bacterium]